MGASVASVTASRSVRHARNASEIAIGDCMKRFGLSPLVASATLFLAARAPAQEAMAPAAKAGATETQMSVASKDGDARSTARAAVRSAELLKRYDKNGDGRIDEDERLAAKEEMLMENIDRQMARLAVTQATPEQLRARVLENFDQNKDGQLDDEERLAAQKFAEDRMANPAPQTGALREVLIKRVDKNGNGRIDAEERTALKEFFHEYGSSRASDSASAKTNADTTAAPPSTAPGPFGAQWLKRFDRNGDGRLDAGERDAAEPVLRAELPRIPQFMRRWDANGDGKIDDDEWAAVRAEQRRREQSLPAK